MASASRAQREYLFDTSSLIQLFVRRFPTKRLDDLVAGDHIKIPRLVTREASRIEGTKLGNWLAKAGEKAVVVEQAHHLQDLPRIAREYADQLRGSHGPADSVVVAMAKWYGNARLVVTDDLGIQAACVLEGLAPPVSTALFIQLES